MLLIAAFHLLHGRKGANLGANSQLSQGDTYPPALMKEATSGPSGHRKVGRVL